MRAGITALTVMPWSPSSSAADFISPSSPHFEAEYAAPFFVPCWGVPTARGAAGSVLRARAGGRPGGVHLLRRVQRLLRRPDREEAAEPLPAGQRGSVIRHRGC